ncbi:hypothetical protein [Achromobacter xylosoxidans]|uniref:Uncharacterized protein n=1 Tax=Alcaligenes xylosoxydans xylosoxydans TaxID=85698 RepID=A0A1R1JMA4_ALCXX|nr:hypothetical protein [Achromobacter xylosoxidans]OMG79334.1 hypothetical protein BIZ92_15160 [Achromobacter xylosoxidans]
MTELILSMQENSAHGAPKKGHIGPDFSTFWAQWPRKTAKKAAEQAWAKLRAADRRAVLHVLPSHLAFWKAARTAIEFIPHPATWLNGERWKDEVVMPTSRPEPKAAAGPAWWTSHVAMDQKGREVGVGSARPGETSEQYRARIQQAIAERDRFGGGR